MSSHVRSDNPRSDVRNRQMYTEKEWNVPVDGAIDDESSIRYPFLKTELGFLQFPENQLRCCDSRMAVLIADPSVNVTVLRRWDVDDKSTSTTGLTYTGSTSAQEESSSRTTKRSRREAAEEGSSDTAGDAVVSSARSRNDRTTETGTAYKTTARVEISDRQPEVSTRFQSSYDVRPSSPKTSDSRRTDTLAPAGSTRVTSLCRTPVIFEPVDPPARSTEITSEETSSYRASRSTPKPRVPSGTIASTTSQPWTAETAEPTGPTLTTASNSSLFRAPDTSKRLGPTGIATEETTRPRATLSSDSQGHVGRADSEESLERALPSFASYSRTVNFMASSPDDVLAMLEDDRVNLTSEWDAFGAANDWVLHDPVRREQHGTRVMSGVRFSLMTVPELVLAVHASRYLMYVQEYRDKILEAFVWRAACECGYGERFLDFEPVPRGGGKGGGRCRCPNGGPRGAQDRHRCCCACRCWARGRTR